MLLFLPIFFLISLIPSICFSFLLFSFSLFKLSPKKSCALHLPALWSSRVYDKRQLANNVIFTSLKYLRKYHQSKKNSPLRLKQREELIHTSRPHHLLFSFSYKIEKKLSTSSTVIPLIAMPTTRLINTITTKKCKISKTQKKFNTKYFYAINKIMYTY